MYIENAVDSARPIERALPPDAGGRDEAARDQRKGALIPNEATTSEERSSCIRGGQKDMAGQLGAAHYTTFRAVLAQLASPLRNWPRAYRPHGDGPAGERARARSGRQALLRVMEGMP